jgi:hypothetical protein
MENLLPLQGALRLAIFDSQGLIKMDTTRQGLWLSFIAPLAVLPLILWISQLQQSTTSEINMLFFLRQALSYIFAVFGFALAAYYLCRYLERAQRAYLLIVAVNWVTPIQSLLAMAGYLILIYSGLPPGVGNGMIMAISMYNVVYLWFVIRTATATSRWTAVGIVGMIALIQYIGYLLTQVQFM